MCPTTWKVIADVRPISPNEHQFTASAMKHVANTRPRTVELRS